MTTYDNNNKILYMTTMESVFEVLSQFSSKFNQIGTNVSKGVTGSSTYY